MTGSADDPPSAPKETSPVHHHTPKERAEMGKAARSKTPREVHAAWDPPSDRPDPISLLEAQAATRIPELVPIRYGRMLVSPFAFYRGAAAIMASDLATLPNTGCMCSCAAMRTWRTSAGSPRRNVS